MKKMSHFIFLSALAISFQIKAQSEDHIKAAVLDAKIGMSMEGRTGYTCTKESLTASGDRKRRYCIKFLDKRCDGKPATVSSLAYMERAPKGCHRETDTDGTRLDNVLLQNPHTGASDQVKTKNIPLVNVRLTGTPTSPSKVYLIEYMLAYDNLMDENSKIRKALIEKYGKPFDINSGKVKWKFGSTDVKLTANPMNIAELKLMTEILNDKKSKSKKKETTKPKAMQPLHRNFNCDIN
jgi:hypothetical protein